MPGRSMNVLTAEVIAEMATIVDTIASDAAIKGAVFTSGKEGFSGGADLTMLKSRATNTPASSRRKAKRRRCAPSSTGRSNCR